MTEVRWGEQSPVGPDEARARILEAAVSCWETKGVRKTTIGDVARAARVTRPTVYKYFRNRDDIILGLMMREGPGFVGRVAAHVQKQDLGFQDGIVEGVLYCILVLPEDRWYGLLFADDALPITRRLVLGSNELLDLAGSVLVQLFEPARLEGRLRAELDPRDFLEWTIRLVFSYAVTPSPGGPNEAALRRMIENLLLPALFRDA